jgi:hypothetical protein
MIGYPELSLRSNSGLKLANAFGVGATSLEFPNARLVNSLGVIL